MNTLTCGAYAASFENKPAKSFELMVKSYTSGFFPAASALGLALGQGYGISKHPKEAEIFFRRAIRSNHIPAPLLLCRFYMRGDSGIIKKVIGVLCSPFAFLYVWICTRFLIFSIHVFRHFNLSVPSMFNEKALKPS